MRTGTQVATPCTKLIFLTSYRPWWLICLPCIYYLSCMIHLISAKRRSVIKEILVIHFVQVCWSQLLTVFDHRFFSSTQSELFRVILDYCSVFEISPKLYHPAFVKTLMCWNEYQNSLSAGKKSVSRIHVCRRDVFSNVHNIYKSPCVLLSLLRKLIPLQQGEKMRLLNIDIYYITFFVVDSLKNYLCSC